MERDAGRYASLIYADGTFGREWVVPMWSDNDVTADIDVPLTCTNKT
ncbi:hypothetical protein AB0H42_17140 [Nocardia sp. NPDC050799]